MRSRSNNSWMGRWSWSGSASQKSPHSWDAWTVGPLDVFSDGKTYRPADGFHRLLAAVKVGRTTVPCNVHEGDADDARIFGMTANDEHGLRMSAADKRACVQWLLKNRPAANLDEISKLAGVSLSTVNRVVKEMNP
ncbi:MAG: hypothetical protein JNM43_28970 [Planctomycetaceae bacterium]|nr:hypothetical protein [Planctomycetaceae bacterium]